jgi:hypothetical protein
VEVTIIHKPGKMEVVCTTANGYRVILRLRQKRWLILFFKCVESFMSSILTQVRKGDGTALPGILLECGAPQSSPISPIILMLYFSPILRLGDSPSRFGYADDVSETVVGTW